MNAPISDLEQRKIALDPIKSFIVQAPAGSGKTSLLVQRYLMLLATVNNPEEIVAITFTRKAAFEMRNRIISALKNAIKNNPTQDFYEATTQKLALAAIKQNQTKGWNIIQNPNRLRIQTIDSFCNYLVKRMPILAKFSIDPKIIQNEEAEIYYREIARTMLENSTEPEYAHYLETLLLHLDNDWQRTENLLITMLKSREQWLPHIVGLDAKKLRMYMEADLKNISQENLERCLLFFPKELQHELSLLLEFSKDNHENPPIFLQQINFTKDLHSNLEISGYRGMAEFLLTKDFSWRKKITKEHGFPAQTSGCDPEEKKLFKSMKDRMENLLKELEKYEDFRISLENLLNSPPQKYNDQQWEMIEALLQLLPLLAAQLKVTFNEYGITDHAEISMAALQALGNNDMPSELALNLDYHLQHLLVDEFQDTSVAQYRLIEKLIAAWQQDDGHTLFVVGDPMQSIYRFREAEVGLFLRMQNEGINMLKLQPLTLTTNFRASQNIIDWINSNFAKIFPHTSDIGLGAVPFRPSVATKQDQDSQVKIELLKNASATSEAMHVISILQHLLKQNPNDTIAILVRARNHLPEIITAMQQAKLNYQADTLETLVESIVVRDLFALTRAFFHPTDRIAWLAILRAPWCGLNLKDLHTLANGNDEIIWDNICNYHKLNLSDDGKVLIEKFKKALDPIFAKCRRSSWHELIEEAWLALGGPATVADEIELEHAKVYLKLLENNPPDIEMIQKKLHGLYAPSTQTANIQIMTMHKAKGLEFDHVVIPGLDRTTRFDERKLMLWSERPKMHGGSNLLLAPIESKGNETDPIYEYLQLAEQKKSFYETGRLLYVAITRAKKTVHLIGCIKYDSNAINETSKESLLKQLYPSFNENWVTDKYEKSDLTTSTEKIKPTKKLQRLHKDWIPIISSNMTPPTILPTWQLIDNQEALAGTVIHYCLKRISESDLKIWTDNYIEAQIAYWHKLLQQAGYIDIDFGLKLIKRAIKLILTDKRGQWILTKHQDAESELALSTTINGKLENFVIDRTFVDENDVRWIIDYKIVEPHQENTEKFLLEEQKKYAQQLLHYAKIMHEFDQTRPIKLGLYFPLFSGWVEIN